MTSSSEPSLPLDETELLARIGAGDRDALRQLYTAYGTALFSFALRLTGSRPDAEEVLQDTFVKIWQHAAAYDSRLSRPFTWAVTILRRTAIDHRRKHRRDPLTWPMPADDDALVHTWTAADAARPTADAHDTEQNVRRALARISSPQRDALELALFSTLTQSEIAARLAQPLGTVKSWIRRGFLELRAALQAIEPTS